MGYSQRNKKVRKKSLLPIIITFFIITYIINVIFGENTDCSWLNLSLLIIEKFDHIKSNAICDSLFSPRHALMNYID